jgi:large subunit ribosomal protein L25
LHFDGEDGCPGVKLGGTVLRGMTDVEIECLPKDLPEFIAVDVSKMEIDDVIHLSEVVIPEGVTLAGADQVDEDNDPMVVTIEVMRGSVDEDEAEESEAGEAPKAEGGAEAAPEED